jgi:hypothetical protein
MTMPASQPVDYIAWLTKLHEDTKGLYRSDLAHIVSLREQLTALQNAVKGCGTSCGAIRCGDRRGLEKSIYLCGPCSIKRDHAITALTHTDL